MALSLRSASSTPVSANPVATRAIHRSRPHLADVSEAADVCRSVVQDAIDVKGDPSIMRNSLRRMLLTAGALVVGTTTVFAQGNGDGNGFPSGGHYTLNIQGKRNCSGDDLTGSNRHTIQVLLNVSSDETNIIDRTNKIFLEPGPSGSQPQVLDGNACDRRGALFQLPIDVSTTWTAYARALSKPNTSMNITSCQVDPGLDGEFETLDDIILCSGTPLVLQRKSGKPVTINATDELLYICVGSTQDNCAGGTQVPIFADSNFLYFWDVDNFGLPNAQIRFYPD